MPTSPVQAHARVSRLTVLTIDSGDRAVATRVRRLLVRPDIDHVASARIGLRSGLRDSVSLALVAAGTDVDWAELGSLAHAVDVVVLAREATSAQARRALSIGAAGYLGLSMSDQTLRAALFSALSGEAAFSRAVLGEWLRTRKNALRAASPAQLTPRQRQILERIAWGDTDKEIAAHLGIAVATAHKHVRNLLRRLRAPNRVAAVAIAHGLLRYDTSREQTA